MGKRENAISLNKMRSYLLGIIVPEFSEPFFYSAFSSIESLTSANNYLIMIGQSYGDIQIEKDLVKKFMDRSVDGLIITPAKNSKQELAIFDELNIPVVFFDCVPDDNVGHFVASSLQTSVSKGVYELINAGHRKIGLINGPATLSPSKQRLAAFTKGLGEYGIEIDYEFVVNTDLSREGNSLAINKLVMLKDCPTGIFVYNNTVFLDCMASLKINRRGRLFNFINFGNLLDWDLFDYKPFGLIDQFPAEQGKMAAKMLMQLISAKESNKQSSLKSFQKYVDADIIFLNDTKKVNEKTVYITK